jgi:hypothetical protein
MNGALGLLFHKLNNQLGIILANAELLEAKASDDYQKARAGQVVNSVLEAMATARELRIKTKDIDDGQGSATKPQESSNI